MMRNGENSWHDIMYKFQINAINKADILIISFKQQNSWNHNMIEQLTEDNSMEIYTALIIINSLKYANKEKFVFILHGNLRWSMFAIVEISKSRNISQSNTSLLPWSGQIYYKLQLINWPVHILHKNLSILDTATSTAYKYYCFISRICCTC